MSNQRKSEQREFEVEDATVFSDTLKKILDTPREERGPAARAIMSAFQIYYEQIGGSFSTSQSSTR